MIGFRVKHNTDEISVPLPEEGSVIILLYSIEVDKIIHNAIVVYSFDDCNFALRV